MIEPAQYLGSRVDDQIAWYEKKSSWNQRQYKKLRMTSLAISAFIPVLLLVQLKSEGISNTAIAILVSIASGVVLLIQGLISLYKYHENWTQYRASAEGLKYHKFLFETGTTPYNKSNAFSIFVMNVETLLSSERMNWVQGNKPEPSKGDEPSTPDNKPGTAQAGGEKSPVKDAWEAAVPGKQPDAVNTGALSRPQNNTAVTRAAGGEIRPADEAGKTGAPTQL